MARYITAPTKYAVLRAIAAYGNVTKAVDAVNSSLEETGDSRGRLHRATVYDWKKKDLSFAESFDDAIDSFADSLEQRALERIDSPSGNRGSDTLLMFMLNGLRPLKYRQGEQRTDDAKETLAAVRLKLSASKDAEVEVVLASGSAKQNHPPKA